MGLGPCTLRNGVTYPVCSTNANLNFRRVLYQQNPTEAAFIGGLDLHTDVGYQNYRGLKLSAQRRSVNGVSLNGNYTLSRCFGIATTSRFTQTSGGYVDPNNPSYDAGYCDQDRRHLATLTVGYETPELANAALRALAVALAAVGDPHRAVGPPAQHPERHRQRVHRHRQPAARTRSATTSTEERTLTNYFNRAAFAQPAPGTLGDLPRNAVVGPDYWNVNLAVSRLIAVTGTQRLELRLEAFNLFNHFNWGDPGRELQRRARSAASRPRPETPRIIQFGIKYDF